MRLHRLEVQALQAFAGRVEVDFDALAGGGLFLLHGETGAGKTTLLDAVVLALYGTLPGAREKHARERSDHADAGVETVVVLEATLRGERIRVTRWPRQERPKQRGAGNVEQPARVQLERWGDDWAVVSSRHDEVSEELDRLLGMSREQFCQVVLLPQGEFATFLRAGSDERWEVLERLFATERFRDAEEWLAGHRRETAAARDAGRVAVRDVANRLAQQTAAELPDGWEERPLELVAWTQERLVGAEASAITGHDACAAAAAARDAAERAVRAAEKLAGQQARRAEDEAAFARLQERRPAREHAAAELRAARRASPLVALLQAADRAQTERATARAAADRALAEVGARPVDADLEVPWLPPAQAPVDRPEQDGELSLFAYDAGAERWSAPEPDREEGDAAAPARLRQTAARLRQRAGEVGGLAATEAELDVREQALAALEGAGAVAGAEVDRTAAELQAAPARRSELVTAYEQALAGSAALQDRGRVAAQAQARLAAARERERLAAAVGTLAAAELQAREAELDARDRWLRERRARVDGMAAELAGSLADGAPCLVCGSVEHPAPARPGPGTAAGPQAEEAARAAHDRTERARDAARDALASAEQQLADARATAGDAALDTLRADASAAEKAHAHARRAAGELQAAGEARDRFDDTLTQLRRVHEQASTTATSAAARAAERRTELDADRGRLVQALGGAQGVADRVADLEAGAAVRETAAEAVTSVRRADASATAALARAGAAASDAGFGSLVAARQAARGAERIADLESRLRDFDEQVVALGAVLADAELAEAALAPAPDVPPLRAAARRAAEDSARVEGAFALARRDAHALKGLERRLQRALDALEPLEAAARQARELALLVDGSATANVKRMRLSAYVLAARLEEIAAAATVRLAAMSGGRYALEHSDERLGGRGRPRGGLDLRVVDAWTGRARHPSTLSGGETFMASLALALGLADVVAAEAGGARLQTLFVDEGFGSLDDATLDEVLDVLDALRAGGRAVGIVSHVGELRQRVAAQLHVVKGRTGSTVLQSVPA